MWTPSITYLWHSKYGHMINVYDSKLSVYCLVEWRCFWVISRRYNLSCFDKNDMWSKLLYLVVAQELLPTISTVFRLYVQNEGQCSRSGFVQEVGLGPWWMFAIDSLSNTYAGQLYFLFLIDLSNQVLFPTCVTEGLYQTSSSRWRYLLCLCR